jgi:hypothetical protein
MAFEIDHSSIDTRANGKIIYSTTTSAGDFEPMRRKMQVDLQA